MSIDIESRRKKFQEIYSKKRNNNIQKLIRQMGDKIKMEFYYEFDELIPSVMSDKIDKITAEYIEKVKNYD